MDETKTTDPIPGQNRTDVNRQSERELVITRTFNGPAQLVFEAWTKPELLMRWWAPKSFGITFLSCEADVRTGGSYRFVFGHPASDQPMAFFGRYIEVTPPTRIVWTNEEGEEGSVTTVTFTERDGKTHLVLSDRYPSRDALDAAIESGSQGAYPEQFEALDALLSALRAEAAG
ncbi:SRPBCC family protein [Devosia sp.]|uniref:SRPBCC family protein n=1 Tax=Devosia sp. TaxID=1871048 RepID=UPI00292F52C5|nr:SRPBCC family protein [Devosia sp.]